MVVLGFLLVLILPLVFLYSLIKPAKFKIRSKSNPNGKWTRIQSFAAFSVSWLVGTILLVQGVQPETASQESNGSVAAPTASTESVVKEPSRKERKAAEQAEKEAELAKEDLQRHSTLLDNSSNRPIISNGWSRMDIYTNCQILLQNNLKSPKSFDSNIRTVKFIRDAEKEIVGVNFDFYAMNSFGAELVHSGTCVYDFNGKLLETSAKAK